MQRGHFFILLFLLSFKLNGQTGRRHEKFRLPPELKEISGLTVLGDTLLVAINDGGNSPELFFLSTKGILVKRTRVVGAENTDWEDLAKDNRGNLYIADVGNNLNNRRDLHILKVSISAALKQDSVVATKIEYFYSDQKAFPPPKEERRFNCEALFWLNDSLFLITKNESVFSRAQRRDRSPRIYAVSDQPGTHQAILTRENLLKGFRFNRRGISELVTGSDYRNGRITVLTYFKILCFDVWSSEVQKPKVKLFFRVLQREAIAISESGWVYIGAEYHRLLGGPVLIKKRIHAD
ncbi:MAG: hypothetical protein RIT43_1952 [Bacteroidota bacterium]|jgi:hypothetical protein